MNIRSARFPDEASLVRELFTEYAAWLSVDLSFQGFADELASLPGKYAHPAGDVLIAVTDGARIAGEASRDERIARPAAAGCIAYRPLEGAVCEMKRLWVRPHARGAGLGRMLVAEMETRARADGYRRVVLDTLRSMKPALRLYLGMGYEETEPYYHNPLPDVVYLAKAL